MSSETNMNVTVEDVLYCLIHVCLRGQPPPDFTLSHRLLIEVAEDIL